jgi:hypothetical protein
MHDADEEAEGVVKGYFEWLRRLGAPDGRAYIRAEFLPGGSWDKKVEYKSIQVKMRTITCVDRGIKRPICQ